MNGQLLKNDKENINGLIHTIRGFHVIIDYNLAKLYNAKTKRLNEQVKRNIERFPTDFMFQLTEDEKKELVTNCDHIKPLKFSSIMPHAFTEQGVATLSGVLNLDVEIVTNQINC